MKEIKKCLDKRVFPKVKNTNDRQHPSKHPSKVTHFHSNMINEFRENTATPGDKMYARTFRSDGMQQNFYNNNNTKRHYSHGNTRVSDSQNDFKIPYRSQAGYRRPHPTTMQPNHSTRSSHYHRSRSDQHHRSENSLELGYAPRHYGCHNCGEPNHRLVDCWFDYRIKCKSCHELGHKTRLCVSGI